MKKKETIAVCTADVRTAIEAYRMIEDKAQQILDAGSCGCDDVAGLHLSKDEKHVEIAYWTTCRGESYIEKESVPIEWFGYRELEVLEKLWEEKREADRIEAEKMKALAKKWQKNNPEKWKTLNKFNNRIWYWKNIKGDIAKANQLERAKKAYLALANSHMRKEPEKHRSIVAYRAKSSGSESWITRGGASDEPLEKTSMNDLAYSIAYLCHRHPVELYTSYDGKKFSKASGALAKTFSKMMDDEFRYDEQRY